jgi:methionyl-tRNA formyltransferase
LKIIFAGTPQFAASALEALLANGQTVAAVLTQPDRPAGRGMRLVASPVKQLAVQHELPVLQPTTLKSAEVQQQLAGYQADIMVVAAYGLLLPTAVLHLPRYGCLNIHASLLPRWRGAAPIQRAILAGDNETGITIMQMDEGLDTGDMLLKLACPIEARDTAQTLHDKLAELGAQAIVTALDRLGQGSLKAISQDNEQATYATKLTKAEAQIDWTRDAIEIDRMVRAYNPFPVAVSACHNVPVKIWQANPAGNVQGEPGTVCAVEKNGIVVACGRGALRLEILQRPGGKVLPAAQFIQGFALQPGDRFAAA